MKVDWLSDARKIPDRVMNYLCRIAVRAVEEKHYCAERIADIFGISAAASMSGCAGIVRRGKQRWIPKRRRERRR